MIKKENIMGKVKAWAMDHEENVASALESGAKSVDEVIAYCRTNMEYVDERYAKQLTLEFWNFDGYPDSMTAEQIQDLDNTHLSEQEHNFGDVF
jgi:hypothetical protein|tara:strand:- start:314 stop:595 length:282 start_codon:yes stop_codon:yes gene_type:complete